MFTHYRPIVAAGSFALVLAGCATDGGNGAAIAPQVVSSTVAFTSFAALKPDEDVVASGVSRSASLTSDTSTHLVSNTVVDQPDTTNTRLTLGFDSTVNLDSVRVEASATDLSWSTAAGDTITDAGLSYKVTSADGMSTIEVMDARDAWLNWNYQTFGIWRDTSVIGTTETIRVGAISAGSLSPVSGIPPTGTATYSGVSGGIYVDAAGVLYSYRSNLVSNADFLAKSLSFNTSATTSTNLSSGTVTSDPSLNLSGTMTYMDGSNQFSGSLSSSGGLTGTATGNFYGTSAEEIGGTYSLTGAGVQTMVGGFGARR